ncbi:MAG: hypothetical protein M1821_004950 [Bathelium mastoideum]|nr:MAG: hypothetical protein M1821_004950 [Bathelium mastoideum]KAI9689006.1 MAG: hypothetical protein M1822_000743 [Bathelium mastoideum]
MGLLGKKFPGPVAQPMTPFYVAGIVILYGVNSFASVMANTEEFKNNPRNQYVQQGQQSGNNH